MIFTIELEGVRTYRLQKDSSWRRLENDSLLESDYQTTNPSEVTERTPYGRELEIEGTLYKISPTVARIGEYLSGGSRVYRRDFPAEIPSKDQLRSVIAKGDDEKMNSLILDLNAQFELRQRPPFDITRNDPTVVVRHETFAAGNDYVGVGAALDENHIEALFSSSLEYWLNHLRNGTTQAYSDLPSTKSSGQLVSELEALKDHWIPHA